MTKVNIKKVLDGLPLERCIKHDKPASVDRWHTLDRVSYRRVNGDIVRGFIDSISHDAAYIFDTRNGDIVACNINRLERG